MTEFAYSDHHQMEEAFGLRARVFSDKLNWVGRNHELTGDAYDHIAVHFGLYDSGTVPKLLGYVRVVASDASRFMLEKEFAQLLDPAGLPYGRERAIEISRLAVLPACLGGAATGRPTVADYLYRAIYRWATPRARRYWYIVTTKPLLYALRRHGFPFVEFGTTHQFQLGTTTVAAVMDCVEAERHLMASNPQLGAWFGVPDGMHGTSASVRWADSGGCDGWAMSCSGHYQVESGGRMDQDRHLRVGP